MGWGGVCGKVGYPGEYYIHVQEGKMKDFWIIIYKFFFESFGFNLLFISDDNVRHKYFTT